MTLLPHSGDFAGINTQRFQFQPGKLTGVRGGNGEGEEGGVGSLPLPLLTLFLHLSLLKHFPCKGEWAPLLSCPLFTDFHKKSPSPPPAKRFCGNSGEGWKEAILPLKGCHTRCTLETIMNNSKCEPQSSQGQQRSAGDVLQLMCTEGAMRGLGGLEKAALWATWVPLGCANGLPNGASEPCPGRWRCEAMNHFITSFCSATTQSTQLLNLQRKIAPGLTPSRSLVHGKLDYYEKPWLPLDLCLLASGKR